MVRPDWLSLNGPWDCAVAPRGATNPGAYTGRILVPFPVESALSGIARPLSEHQRLWCRLAFSVPPAWRERRVLLHFEGVDWDARVWVNGAEAGAHRGGYDRFSFDITQALKPEGSQELVVSAYNPAGAGPQPRGRQAAVSRGVFHSACSGIWQTVWLEPVPESSIDGLKLAPDIDAAALTVTATGRGETNHAVIEAVAYDGEKEVGRARGAVGQALRVPVPAARLWSPASPFLYTFRVALLRQDRALDQVSSYFGMREISLGRSEAGFPVVLLNNQPLLQVGVVDQGCWPDGLYTAPTDAALAADVAAIRIQPLPQNGQG